MMTNKTLQKCKATAHRFLEAIKDLEIVEKEWHTANPKPPSWASPNTPRENGAVKRASMDLTRALADLRAGR